MGNIIKTLVDDIFAMRFDVVIPISGCLVAVLLGLALFLIRYVGYNYNRFKYQSGKKKKDRAAWRTQIREETLKLQAEEDFENLMKERKNYE